MKYENIILFTRTLWNEPPRMRHQLTKMLLSHGHKVSFFEKSSIKQLRSDKLILNNLKLIRHFELLHHQLRPLDCLVKINNFITKKIIHNKLKKTNIDLIINFNYDYFFLKEIFPNKTVVTIINDDFVAQAKKWMTRSISKQLENTCKNSDIVFTVSYPLFNKLIQFNSNTHLFFPWTEKKYQHPKISTQRDVVLYWGYINNRLDWSIIEYLLTQKIKLRFVGKIVNNASTSVEKYIKYDNFELIEPQDLSNLNLDDICCSILPYKTDVEALKVVTISNRAFQILAYGIPLVYAALPNLLAAPDNVIMKCTSPKEYLDSIKHFSESFHFIQPEIENFLENHYAEIRYNYFFDKIKYTIGDINNVPK